LCDNLLPLPHNLLKILRRFISSSTVFEGEEERSTCVDDDGDSDKIAAGSIDEKKFYLN
jgi:hypothetical protein